MTQQTLSRIIISIIIFLIIDNRSAAAYHGESSATNHPGQTMQVEQHDNGGSSPVFPLDAPSVPHGKMHTPQLEELPHIHKFHKERVKKMRKHHGKCWILSQLIIVLCHLSILLIGYLHLTH